MSWSSAGAGGLQCHEPLSQSSSATMPPGRAIRQYVAICWSPRASGVISNREWTRSKDDGSGTATVTEPFQEPATARLPHPRLQLEPVHLGDLPGQQVRRRTHGTSSRLVHSVEANVRAARDPHKFKK